MSQFEIEHTFDRCLPERIWSRQLRRKALILFKKGYGYKNVAKALEIPASTVRDWGRAFREAQFHPKVSDNLLSYRDEAKQTVCRLANDGMRVSEIVAMTGVARSTCYAWIRRDRRDNGFRGDRRRASKPTSLPQQPV